MAQTDFLYRSVLYMPGSKERALEKAKTLDVDALILDLEDAVSPAEKPQARDMVCAAVKGGGYGPRKLIIRVNGLDTEWGEDDLKAAAEAQPDAILIPKVSSPTDLVKVEGIIKAAGANGNVKLWAMMETPLGMLNAAAIAGATPRLEGFVMGTNDLVKELNAAHTMDRVPVITALSLCLLAARAHGLICVDGVYNAFKDDDGLRYSCEQGRDFGFDGKTLIHPAQLAITNEVF
ncbi:MAG TPA: CoA ester lyase, partial [Paracoccaceae bacterium]|nr:CoA ester lyase [Paracoccaceae bacterium]